jgi:hypothetical protein
MPAANNNQGIKAMIKETTNQMMTFRLLFGDIFISQTVKVLRIVYGIQASEFVRNAPE